MIKKIKEWFKKVDKFIFGEDYLSIVKECNENIITKNLTKHFELWGFELVDVSYLTIGYFHIYVKYIDSKKNTKTELTVGYGDMFSRIEKHFKSLLYKQSSKIKRFGKIK